MKIWKHMAAIVLAALFVFSAAACGAQGQDGEPMGPAEIYTVAGSDYLLTGHGDGMTAFDGCTMLAEQIGVDNQVLIE